MHFRAARRRRRALRVFPPKRLIARECVAFYVGELRFEVVVDPDGPRDRMFFFLRRLPAQNVASQVRCAPAAGAARSSSPRATCGPTETPRPSMSSPWRYMSTDDDRALGKDANHVLWPWARRFSRMFDAVRRPRDAARAPRRAPRPRRTISEPLRPGGRRDFPGKAKKREKIDLNYVFKRSKSPLRHSSGHSARSYDLGAPRLEPGGRFSNSTG